MATFTPKQFMNHISSIAHSFPSEISDALVDASVAAEDHFDESFDNEGFTDGGHINPWKPNAKSTVFGKGHDTILKGRTGDLRKSQNKRMLSPSGGYRGARIEYKVSYADLQNNGGVNKQGYSIPARKFIGNSKVLNGMIRSIFGRRVSRIFGISYTKGR